VLIAVIGTAGTVVGAVATALISRAKSARPTPTEPAETTPVLGEAVDIRELRILRALFGEPKGRLLEAYKDKYYRSSLEAVVQKGWVKQIEGRYYMTQKGAEFCRVYLKQLLGSWQPAAQVLG
jgi:hypothetical protein